MPFARSSIRCEDLEPRRLFSTYFIDAANGSDLSSGRSATAAWQTLGMVANHTFRRGDRIYLTGTFVNQTLTLGPNALGVSVNTYVTVGPRKTARVGVANAAVLTGEQADGVDITTSFITLQNLSITADPSVVTSGNYNYGVYVHNATSTQLTHETINNVTASGFSYSGLCMQGWNGTAAASAGFSNVLIENSSFHDNQVSGIFAGTGDSTGNEFEPDFPDNLYVNASLTIRNCQAYNNAGFNSALAGTSNGVDINQGNATSGGIFISSITGAMVQHCTTYNNCFASRGGVGTWAFDASNVIFQNDESYDTGTTDLDGDGFDFDHGVTHSLMQYDYAHGNAGVGFLIATTGGSSNDVGDTIRFSIADDNHGGIFVATTADVPALSENIYNNTVLVNDAPGQFTAALGVNGDAAGASSVNVLNNIFYSTGTDPTLLLDSSAANVKFERNDYWMATSPGSFSASVGGTDYVTLADWIAANPGEETFNGATIGLVADPMLVNETVSDLPIASVRNLMLAPKSPLRREAEVLSSRPWAGSAPYNADAPYNLAGRAWSGLGRVNYFGRPINARSLGAG